MCLFAQTLDDPDEVKVDPGPDVDANPYGEPDLEAIPDGEQDLEANPDGEQDLEANQDVAQLQKICEVGFIQLNQLQL